MDREKSQDSLSVGFPLISPKAQNRDSLRKHGCTPTVSVSQLSPP